MEQKLERLLLGRKGGLTTAKIIKILFDRPFNANQLSKKLKMHYNTIYYQINLLMKNDIIRKENKKYGALLYLTPEMQKNQKKFEKIVEKII